MPRSSLIVFFTAVREKLSTIGNEECTLLVSLEDLCWTDVDIDEDMLAPMGTHPEADIGFKVARIGENSGGGTLILQGGRITSDGQFASFNIGNGSNYGTVILEGGTLDLQDNVNIKNGFLHIKDGVTVTDNNGNFIVLDPSTVKFDINTSLGANPEDALSEWTSNGNDMKLESGSTLDLDFLNGADTGTVFTLFSGVQNIWDDDNFAGEFGMVDVTGLELDQSIVMTYTAESAGGAADGTITATVVPEPATMSLLALGGMAMLRRRKK